MSSRDRPSAYQPLPFHVVRLLSFISTLIVSGVLGYFCYQLKHDGFKLPWTLLIMLAASLLAAIALLVTSVVQCCAYLSPILNMFFNIPILLLWTIGMALLVWNMYGTLAHSCSTANWGSDDGMMVCRMYKGFFSFVIIGWLAQIALVVLDVRAKRAETSLVAYDRMDESRDVKMDSLPNSIHPTTHDVPYGIDEYRERDEFSHQHQHRRNVSEYQPASGDVRMRDFEHQYPPQQVYDNRQYGYGHGHGHGYNLDHGYGYGYGERR